MIHWHGNVVIPLEKDAENLIEISIYESNPSFRRELDYIFPNLKTEKPIYVLPTFQCARIDLVNFGDDVEIEKERLLLVVYNFTPIYLFMLLFALFDDYD